MRWKLFVSLQSKDRTETKAPKRHDECWEQSLVVWNKTMLLPWWSCAIPMIVVSTSSSSSLLASDRHRSGQSESAESELLPELIETEREGQDIRRQGERGGIIGPSGRGGASVDRV